MEAVRRLFITKQHLNGDRAAGSFRENVVNLIRELAYIQWDPVTVVAPSHLISLWSRIGNFQHSDLDELMWQEKYAFLHWTPIAVLVLTEDYPLFNSLMKRYPNSLGRSWGSHISTAQKFIDSHLKLAEKVLDKLSEGPADLRQFKDYGKRKKSEDGWSSGNEVSTLLYHLHMMGKVMVSGHAGNQNMWSLTDSFLPDWADKSILSPEEFDRLSAQRALKALGVASELDINRYFVRGRYYDIKNTLETLENESELLEVRIEEASRMKKHYIYSGDVEKLESVENKTLEPTMRLISPFDNLISIRERTKRIFNFDYILEQFVPKEKRKYGTYVLPILWRDRLVGRIDAKLEKEANVLSINSVHSEPGFEKSREIPESLHATIGDFAEFLGADKVAYGRKKPEAWSSFLT